MSITAYGTTRNGNVTTVVVTSDLSGTIYYHWYVDGAYVATSQSATHSFYLGSNEQVRIEVIDTNNIDYDYIANAPDGYPAYRTLHWVRSQDTDVDFYRVEQNKDGAGWITAGTVSHDASEWDYSLLTARLTDLSSYQWQIIPVDLAGNDGTAISLASEKIVRTPDAPDFDIAYSSGTTKVTFSAA